MMMRMRSLTSWTIVTALLSFLACDRWAPSAAKEPPRFEAAPGSVKVDRSEPERRTEMVTSYAPVVEKAGPAVVNIFTTQRVRIQEPLYPFMEDPFFRHFFGLPDQGRRGAPQFREQTGLGSGVIVTEDGYILTNNHVVDVADEIRILLGSGRKEYVAELVGKDPLTDVAVLKIKAQEKLPAITLGDSAKVKVGDVALAVGNPFGLGQTVTMGIISDLRRNLPSLPGEGADMIANFIQTDAPINPGNSGGALIDAEGRLIGINTAILSRTGGSVGIGFAIPINLARNVMEQLIRNGKVVRGFLGVNIQPVTPDLAEQFGLPELSGALVAQVTPKSPAEKAGIEVGDVIVKLNDQEIGDPSALRVAVTQLEPGTQAKVEVVRGGKRVTLQATIEKLPEDERIASRGRQQKGQSSETSFGLELSDVTRDARERFAIPSDVQGALIAGVASGSLAAQGGLRPGDVILSVNRVAVKTAKEAERRIKDAKGGRVLLLVWSQGGTRFVVLGK